MYNIFMDFNIIYIFFHYKIWRKIAWKITTCSSVSWITSVEKTYIINYYARLSCNFIFLNLVQNKLVIYRLISVILIITSKIAKQYLLLIELNTLLIAMRNNLICLQLQNNVNFLVQHERRISRLGQIKDVTFVVGA